MAEIIFSKRATVLGESLKRQGKSIVLVGGCFDVLHPGHISFLDKVKREGDCLFVLLESDQKVKKLKGLARPVHTQKQRAAALSSLPMVDYIVLLPYLEFDRQYDELIKGIKPDIIATTSKDKVDHHQRAAKLVGAKCKIVAEVIGDYSTSNILNHSK